MMTVLLPLTPAREEHQLEYGDVVGVRDVRRLAALHRRAARATPLLLADGWDVWFVGAGLEADHPDVATREEAEGRLAVLGIPLGWVEVFDDSSADGPEVVRVTR